MKTRLIPILFAVLFMVSCQQPKEIVKTEYITKTEYVDRYVHDSVYVDKYHNVYIKGDTVFSEKTLYKYAYKFVHDTMSTTDTVYKDNIVTKTVVETKPVYWPLWLAAVLYIIFVAITLFIRKAK